MIRILVLESNYPHLVKWPRYSKVPKSMFFVCGILFPTILVNEFTNFLSSNQHLTVHNVIKLCYMLKHYILLRIITMFPCLCFASDFIQLICFCLIFVDGHLVPNQFKRKFNPQPWHWTLQLKLVNHIACLGYPSQNDAWVRGFAICLIYCRAL